MKAEKKYMTLSSLLKNQKRITQVISEKVMRYV